MMEPPASHAAMAVIQFQRLLPHLTTVRVSCLTSRVCRAQVFILVRFCDSKKLFLYRRYMTHWTHPCLQPGYSWLGLWCKTEEYKLYSKYFEYFCQVSSKLILIILSYTVSKLVRFLRQVLADRLSVESKFSLSRWNADDLFKCFYGRSCDDEKLLKYMLCICVCAEWFLMLHCG